MWIPVILFIILSPGILFTIPTTLSPMSQQTSVLSVLIHAVLFVGALKLIHHLKQVTIEGFEDTHVEGWSLGNSCGTEYCKAPKYYCKENAEQVKYCTDKE